MPHVTSTRTKEKIIPKPVETARRRTRKTLRIERRAQMGRLTNGARKETRPVVKVPETSGCIAIAGATLAAP
jgi:hypothetical protein